MILYSIYDIMMKDSKLYNFVKDSTSSFDESHDINHAFAVYINTMLIATENMELDILTYASMLHDVCDHKYPESIKKEKLIEFINQELDEQKCKRVIKIIDNISFSKQIKGLRETLKYPDNIYLDIISDADKLEAIGQIGLDRCIAYTKATGGIIPDDVIKHCHEKLLLLKDHYIVTKKGKELAQPLHKVIENYISIQ